MSPSQLTLVIPNLLPNLVHQNLAMPGLAKLLARADILPMLVQAKDPLSRSSKTGSHSSSFSAGMAVESLLFQLFSLPITESLPIAAITGLADGLETQKGYWLRLDPMEFRVDLAAVYLLGNDHLTQSLPEKQLRTLLALDNLELFTPHTKRWYLCLEADPQIQTYLPSQVLGKNLSAFLPYGENQTFWRKLMTEIQMLFYSQQTEHSPSLINGIWLWGGGWLPSTIPQCKWQAIWTNDVLAQGLARFCKIPVEDVAQFPKDFSQTGEYLAVINPGEISSLDEEWFLPLVKALRNKQLTQLDLYLGDDRVYRINSRTIHYFWRKRMGMGKWERGQEFSRN